MTIRLLCKQTSKHPSNALFLKEQKTRIAPTRIINETELDLTAGMVVTVNNGTERKLKRRYVWCMELSSQKQHLLRCFRSTIYTESLLFVTYMSVMQCYTL